ncbi:MAG: phosphate acyltransferase PlsX [Pseudomonadota bacterium]
MTAPTVLSVDVMGGDKGPAPVIAGLARVAAGDPDIRFILHGDADEIKRLVRRRRRLRDRIEIRHAEGVVSMDAKPSRALRNGRGTSLWQSLESVSSGEASTAVSSGNTGAIVAMAMLVLRKAPNIDRPAIAVHWPARNENGFNVVLDMGADIRADANNLVQYAVMGAEYARLAASVERPRVGLLNVGSEDTKGHQDLRQAKEMLTELATDPAKGFSFSGFVEGTDILSDRIDVVVTDGFTGNIAMKASEGTAAFIRTALKEAFSHSILSRFGALFALGSFRRLRIRIDPRRANGGVFLGLNGNVVKSHGGADAVGHAAAISLAAKIAANDLTALVTDRMADLRLPDTHKTQPVEQD